MSEPLRIPLDVRLMNISTAVLVLVLVGYVLWAVTTWAMRQPVFAVRGIELHGDLQHNNAATMRANVMPRLVGNFFTMDLGAARTLFEGVPWVRQAVVQRHFPGVLRVNLKEHAAVALWGEDTDSRLVNEQGEVFEANSGDVDGQNLPVLIGPTDRAPDVLTMYRRLQAEFKPLDMRIDNLSLTKGGDWRVQFDSGATVELGRGDPDEVASRTDRFVKTLTQVVTRYGRTVQSLESADLRHTDGYALRLRGVTTVNPDDKAAGAPKAPNATPP